jgi:hypothetical protein
VDRWLQVPASRREAIRGGVACAATFDETCSFHLLETLGEKVGRDAGKAAQEIRVALRPKHEIPHDEQRPSFAEDVEGAGEAAVLVV